jgi:hypothetical protein
MIGLPVCYKSNLQSEVKWWRHYQISEHSNESLVTDILKIEAVYYAKSFVATHQITRWHSAEDLIMNVQVL